MKILIIQDYLRSGGTERQSVLLANGLAAAGEAVTLLTFRPGGALAATVDARVDFRSLQPFDLGLDWFAPGLLAAVRRIAPDVVICHGRMANCQAGRIQAERPAAAVVATMRTGKPLPWLFRRSLRRVTHVVANSREARDNLVAAHGIPAGKITLIYNALVFPPASDLARNDVDRAARGAASGTLVLLNVAMLRPEKRHAHLIRVVAGLPKELDWQLWLAGDGSARARCEALAAELGVDGRVKFLGFQRDPGALYRAADVAVHASGSEALSNFIIEAQAHGLPAVVCAAQGMAETHLPGETGWIVGPEDEPAFRAAILRLAHESPAARMQRAAAARRFARETFDPATQLAAYRGLFARLRTGDRVDG
jgi:glycosyltransferase involved in cell wall biosynthesis